MRSYRTTAACSLLLLALVGKTTADQPNIVLILADDLAWSDLACYGHPYHRTPNLDRLAEEGMRFTNAYSPAPICSAARASILTGKAVARLGFEFVTKNRPGRQNLDTDLSMETPPLTLNLPLAETTIAESLGSLGYETAFFGKWHVSQHYGGKYLAWHPKYGPKAQGFQIAEEDFGDHPYAWRKGATPGALPSGVYPKDSMVDRVADYIRGPNEQPFFVMASSFYVHTPVRNRTPWLVNQYDSLIPKDLPARQKRTDYGAFVETLDYHVGTILDAIEASGEADDTLVVFTSDNGGHPEFCANAPLRGSKWNLYEGGIRVPFIARWQGEIRSGSSTNTPVIGYDLMPTFTDLAGGAIRGVDGVSIAGSFGGAVLPLRTLIWHFPYYHPEATFSKAIEEIGVDDFAISKTRPQSAIRRGHYKAIQFAEDSRLELYDLEADIGEQVDLSRSRPDVAQAMQNLLEAQLIEMKARRARPREAAPGR